MESYHWQVVSYLDVQKQVLLCAGLFQGLPRKVTCVLQEGDPEVCLAKPCMYSKESLKVSL